MQREAGWAWRVFRVALAIVGVCAVGYLLLVLWVLQQLSEPNNSKPTGDVVFANRTAGPVVLVRVDDTGDELWSASIKSGGRRVESIGHTCWEWTYQVRNTVGITIKTFTYVCAGDVLEIP